MRGSSRLRAVPGGAKTVGLAAVAVLLTVALPPTAPAGAADGQRVSADVAVARVCHAKNVSGAAGTQSVRTTATESGLVRASLSGGGDWDLGVFDANSGRFVAGSAGFASNELAEGFVKAGQKLVVQACRYRGAAASADLAITYVKIATKSPARCRSSTSARKRKDVRQLQSLGLDLTEHGDKDSVEVVAARPG